MSSRRRRYASLPPSEPRLLDGARLFNDGEFFASHEVWEALWHELDGEERELLQGLIQVAAAYYHLVRGNQTGARYLYGRARARLARWMPSHAGVDVGGLLAQIDRDFSTTSGAVLSSRPRIIVGG